MTILSHLGDEDTRTATFSLCKLLSQLASQLKVLIVVCLWFIHAWYCSNYCFITSYYLLAGIWYLTQRTAYLGTLHGCLKEIALTSLNHLCQCVKCFFHLLLIAVSLQFLQCLFLLLTHSGIVHLEDIDRIFMVKTILVGTHDSLLTTVYTSLSTSSSLLDTHLRHTGLNSLSHATEFFDFLNESPCLMH